MNLLKMEIENINGTEMLAIVINDINFKDDIIKDFKNLINLKIFDIVEFVEFDKTSKVKLVIEIDKDIIFITKKVISGFVTAYNEMVYKCDECGSFEYNDNLNELKCEGICCNKKRCYNCYDNGWFKDEMDADVNYCDDCFYLIED